MEGTTHNPNGKIDQIIMSDNSIKTLYELREKLKGELADVERTIALLEVEEYQRRKADA